MQSILFFYMRSVVLFKALQFRRHETSPFVVILLLLATEKQSVFVLLDVVFPVPGCYLYVTQSFGGHSHHNFNVASYRDC
jgi:hypothetical protein